VNHYVAKPVDEQSFVRLVAAVTAAPTEEPSLAGSGHAGALAE